MRCSTIVPVGIGAVLALAVCNNDRAYAACSDAVKANPHAKIQEFRAVPKFAAPGPAFEAAAARGKTVFNIPLISTTAFNEIVDEGEAEAAKVVGLKFVEFKNEGNPSQWVAGMNQAIGQKVDLIILEGSPDPRALTVQLAEAKSSGNPSIS
jgi:ribose transport system substrate-binding protein